jgi:hypothetical protein
MNYQLVSKFQSLLLTINKRKIRILHFAVHAIVEAFPVPDAFRSLNNMLFIL